MTATSDDSERFGESLMVLAEENQRIHDEDGLIDAVEEVMDMQVEKYLKAGINVNCRRKSKKLGETPLTVAYMTIFWEMYGWGVYLDMIQLLLNNNSDVNIQEEDGSTPLHIATVYSSGHPDAVQLLLDNKADVHVRDQRGDTPLHRAGEYKAVTELLIHYNADVNVRNYRGETPLHLAGTSGTIEVLLNNNAEIGSQDGDGQTPLHLACNRHNYDAVQFLLTKDANVNARDKNRRTPLHTAIYARSSYLDVNLDHQKCYSDRVRDAVQLLLQNGANASMKCSDGLTAEEIIDRGHVESFHSDLTDSFRQF
jgi:ankyrin repeat protein